MVSLVEVFHLLSKLSDNGPIGGRFAFLSIGSKEKHAAPKILHHVQDNMKECADILRKRGCETEYVIGPGNHVSFMQERFDAGLIAIDAFLNQ